MTSRPALTMPTIDSDGQVSLVSRRNRVGRHLSFPSEEGALGVQGGWFETHFIGKRELLALAVWFLPTVMSVALGAGVVTSNLTWMAIPIALTVLVLVLLPSEVLPGLAVLFWYGLNITTLQGTVVGNLLFPEVILGIWLCREAFRLHSIKIHRSQAFLLLAVGWILLSSVLVGVAGTPVLHLVLLGVVVIAIDSGARIMSESVVNCLIILVLYEAARTFAGPMERLYGNDPAQLGFLALAAFLLTARRPQSWRLTGVRICLVLVVLATQTRSVYLALLVIVVLKLARNRSLSSLLLSGLVAVGAGALGLGALNELLRLSEGSAELRLSSIWASLSLIEDEPLFGIGWTLGGASDALSGLTSQGFSVYNAFLLFAVAGGLPALFCFTYFVVAELSASRLRDDASFYVLASFAAQGLVEASFFPGSPIPLIVLLVVAMSRRGALTPDRQPSFVNGILQGRGSREESFASSARGR